MSTKVILCTGSGGEMEFFKSRYDQVYLTARVDDADWFDSEEEADVVMNQLNREKVFGRKKLRRCDLYKSFK